MTAYAVSSSGEPGLPVATTEFTVGRAAGLPLLRASPPYVSPGGGLVVSGRGFAGNTVVTLSLPASPLARLRTTPSGVLRPSTLRIPPEEPFGPATLTASQRRRGLRTAVVIVVANSWPQFGYDAARDGYEPQDRTFVNLITPGDGIFVDPAYAEALGAPVTVGPAIADDTAYLGTASGEVMAVRANDHTIRWSTDVSPGGAITGSPAVDPGRALVFVGTSSGYLDALSTETGRLVWQAYLGGVVLAPALKGERLFGASSTGQVAELSSTCGDVVWRRSIHGRIEAAPALDSKTGTLVLAQPDRVLGLASSDGRQRWNYGATAPVTAPPIARSGRTYIGEADGVVALDDVTGKAIWSFATAGSVSAMPAMAGSGRWPDLIVGSSAGTLYSLGSEKGSLGLVLDLNRSAITGLATVGGLAVFTMADGEVSAAYLWGQYVWSHQVGAVATAPPAIVDGTIYVGGYAGLYAFTSYGQLPAD